MVARAARQHKKNISSINNETALAPTARRGDKWNLLIIAIPPPNLIANIHVASCVCPLICVAQWQSLRAYFPPSAVFSQGLRRP